MGLNGSARPSNGSSARPSGSSAERAKELGLSLSSEALIALKQIPLGDALYILEQTASKGSEVKNHSKYIESAIARGVKRLEDDEPPPKRARPTSGDDFRN